MKTDILMYEKIYQILKNKIECGLLPVGYQLPSRANLCNEFHTSEKTIRRVMAMLAEDGLVETSKRRRPTVAAFSADLQQEKPISLKKADATAANDLLKTGILLCYPINRKGMFLCKSDEWKTPEAIIAKMDPDSPTEFWRLSNRLWRFFISRNGNELIMRAVDSLGFSDVDPLPGTFEMRSNYKICLQHLIGTIRAGGNPENVHFDDLFFLYGFHSEGKDVSPEYSVRSDSPMCIGVKGLNKQLRGAQERYSSVYLDILGLIAIGRYQPGDRLPSHEELQKIYHVSIDTTRKAIQMLQEWGAVTAQRGKGIFVAMDLKALKKIDIDPALIACHVRRFLDSLELLSLTVEGVSAHAAAYVTAEEVRQLYHEIDRLWNGPYLYQLSPIVMLEFIVDHIQYEALRTIYDLLRQNYHVGRSIPKLIGRAKTPASYEIYKESLEAVSYLMEGDILSFSKKTAAMFHSTHQLIISECRRLGYLETAMKVYDGSALWK